MCWTGAKLVSYPLNGGSRFDNGLLVRDRNASTLKVGTDPAGDLLKELGIMRNENAIIDIE